MEWEGKVTGATLRCSATQAVIEPGAEFVSVLRWDGTAFSRADYSAAAWPQVDQAAILSWWRQHAPRPNEKRARLRLDGEALARIFGDLKDSTERPQQCFCFVVCLALMRMKLLRLRSVDRDAKGAVLVLASRKGDIIHKVRDPGMSEAEQDAVHQNLLSVVSLDGMQE